MEVLKHALLDPKGGSIALYWMLGHDVRRPNGCETVLLVDKLATGVARSLGLDEDAATMLACEALGMDGHQVLEAGAEVCPRLQADYVHRACTVLWNALLERGRRDTLGQREKDEDEALDIPPQLLRPSGPTAEEDGALRMNAVGAVIEVMLSTCVCALHPSDAASLCAGGQKQKQIDPDLEAMFLLLRRTLTASSLELMGGTRDALFSRARSYMLAAIPDMPQLVFVSEDVIHAPNEMASFLRRGARLGTALPSREVVAAAVRALSRRKAPELELCPTTWPLLRMRLQAGGTREEEGARASPPLSPGRPHLAMASGGGVPKQFSSCSCVRATL